MTVGALRAMCCVSTGDWKGALELLESTVKEMRADGSPASVTSLTKLYTTAITACGRSRQWKAALDVLNRMCKAGASGGGSGG